MYRDYVTFSGVMLERYFKRVLIEKQAFTRIGSWWDRKGENEIDIVTENELDDTATFFEVKRKAENIDMEKLEAKAAAFMRATGEFKGYSLSYKGLSMTVVSRLLGHGSTDVTEKVYARFLPETLSSEVARLKDEFKTLEII